MNSFFKWIREHVKPYVKWNNDHGDFSVHDDDKIHSVPDIIDEVEDKAEVGIQLEFKF